MIDSSPSDPPPLPRSRLTLLNVTNNRIKRLPTPLQAPPYPCVLLAPLLLDGNPIVDPEGAEDAGDAAEGSDEEEDEEDDEEDEEEEDGDSGGEGVDDDEFGDSEDDGVVGN